MQVPRYRPGRWISPARTAAALLFLAGTAAHALPRPPQPAIKLQLANLGFPGVPQGFQDAGASMLTAHFVDSTHLLLTYSLRGLVERIPGDPPEDDDRAVAALLLELPSGKVLAKTRWHLHDHGQYLWSAGDGRFLLRTRSTLTAIAPLANLPSGDAFRQMPFARVAGRLGPIIVSPEHDLVTIESAAERRQHGQLGDIAPDAPPPTVLFSFLRISGSGAPDSPLLSTEAGRVRAVGAGDLPINGRGYLFAESQKRNRWTMTFDSFDGQTRKLSNVDSSCPPQMQFVSPSQFVVFSCRGANDNLMLSAFDFAPHEMWEEPMSGVVPFDQFAYAQQAGRFALSRTDSTLSSPSIVGFASAGPGPSSTQEVRVYQVQSGDLLLKLPCTPSSRTGQNFDLSADGLNFLVVRNGAIEIYALPPLTAQDKKDLAEVRQFEPPANVRPVLLRRLVKGSDVTTAEAPAETASPASAAVAGPPVAPDPSATGQGNAPAGSSDMDLPRKKPSLLNPGESPEEKKLIKP